MNSFKLIVRQRHCYRPYQYSDWEKKPGEMFYTLKCPPCPVYCPPPAVIVAKECKVCSFWQQIRDHCCGYFWPIQEMGMKSPAILHDFINKKNIINKQESKEYEEDLGCPPCGFRLHYCHELPPCPEANWERTVDEK